MTYLEKNIEIKAFEKRLNPNINGSYCALDSNHFIDYREKCYIHPTLDIIICTECRKKFKKKLKFHNIPQSYNGHKYHSKLEAEFAKQLDLKLQAGQIRKWEKQKKLEVNVKIIDGNPVLTSETVAELKDKGIEAYHITNYYMDFVVENNDGSITFYETKGMELPLWKLKFRLIEILYRDKANIEVIKKGIYKKKIKKSKKKGD